MRHTTAEWIAVAALNTAVNGYRCESCHAPSGMSDAATIAYQRRGHPAKEPTKNRTHRDRTDRT